MNVSFRAPDVALPLVAALVALVLALNFANRGEGRAAYFLRGLLPKLVLWQRPKVTSLFWRNEFPIVRVDRSSEVQAFLNSKSVI
jgi:hypothetical protein